MREISVQKVTEVVRRLCIEANCHLPKDVKNCIETCRACEPWPQAQEILDRIIENYEIADQNVRPICQDTGVACVFVNVGQEVHFDGSLSEAIHEGVRATATAICARALSGILWTASTPATIPPP